MSFVDDFNKRASQAAVTSGRSHSWDDYFKEQEQQRILKELQNKNTKKAQPKGNLLTSLIPTAGGVGGALAGAGAGAALGSVVPIVGTAAGGLIGAILGGAGGSAAGKVGQNAVEGEADLGKGVAGEALLGGITSTPIGAGLKIARAGVKATTGIGKRAAGDLIQEAGVQTIGKGAVKRGVTNGTFDDRAGLAAERLGFLTPGIKTNGTAVNSTSEALNTSAQSRLKGRGNQLLASQYGTVPKNIATDTNPAETFGRIADAGITKPQDVERIGSKITGADGLITRATADAVGKAGGVDYGTLRQVFNDAADNVGLVEKDRASLEKLFGAQSKRLSGGALGLSRFDGKANPTDSLSVMKSLEKRIATLDRTSINKPERGDQADVLKLVKNELEDQLYTGAGANNNLASVLTPKLRKELVNLQPNNPKWQNYVDNTIMSSKDVGSLRSSVAPFARSNIIIDEASKNAATYGGRVANAFNQGGVKNMLGEAATGLVKNPVARAAANTMRNGSNILPNGVSDATNQLVGKSVGQGVLPLTVRQGAGRLITADTPVAPEIDANGLTPEDYATLQTNPIFSGSQLGAQADPMAEQGIQSASNPFGIKLSDVAAQMTKAIQSGDTKGYATLSDLYDRINEYETTSGGGELGATAKNALGASANAVGTLDQLEGLFAQAGGGNGRILGGVNNLLGSAGLNNNVDVYNSQADSTITQLAKALNGGGQVTDADARVVINALPRVTDNPEVAAQKFAALRQRLELAAQNTVQYGGGSTDLASILQGYSQ